MLRRLSHLAIEAKYLPRARAFYADRLGLDPVAESDRELRFRAGDVDLLVRRPRSVPRGGLHVHYALTTPTDELDDWRERLADLDPESVSFGDYTSLYVDDPDGHCVEIGGTEPDRPDATGLTGVFEVVFEVADLDRAEALYRALGFEVVDRGDDRRRVRLRGPFDLELWEPQLGLADARGGVHVDLGLVADDPAALAERVRDRVRTVEDVRDGVRFLDPDGHRVTLATE